jgi:hypothetical protein
LARRLGGRSRGDELVSRAKVRWTHGITVHTRASEVWPWLVQMGCRRAGWYSYDGLDNGGVASAEQVVAELQRAAVGDIFPMTPAAEDGFVVRAVEPERALVLGDPVGSATWAFVLEPIDETSTRLITRVRAGGERVLVGLVIGLVVRPIHFGMQRRQLLNLKRLAEARPDGAPAGWLSRSLCGTDAAAASGRRADHPGAIHTRCRET